MKPGGIDKLCDQVCEGIDAEIRSSFDSARSRGESPIEALIRLALRWRLRDDYSQPYQTYFPEIMTEDQVNPFELSVEPQARVLDWPVDFLIRVRTSEEVGRLHKAVVECDGHDFHERTKDQAVRDRSRDRRLQEAGIRVFRFTGAEIYRDPMGCAEEIISWAEPLWNTGLPV